MNIIKLIRNIYIDLLIQREFLGGVIESIDGYVKIHPTESTGYKQIFNIFFNHINIW